MLAWIGVEWNISWRKFVFVDRKLLPASASRRYSKYMAVIAVCWDNCFCAKFLEAWFLLPYTLTSGVVGSWYGTLLFLIYINDLVSVFNSFTPKLGYMPTIRSFMLVYRFQVRQARSQDFQNEEADKSSAPSLPSPPFPPLPFSTLPSLPSP